MAKNIHILILQWSPKPFTKELTAIKERIESLTTANFTTCLLNLYRDGKDSNGWHADDETGAR